MKEGVRGYGNVDETLLDEDGEGIESEGRDRHPNDEIWGDECALLHVVHEVMPRQSVTAKAPTRTE